MTPTWVFNAGENNSSRKTDRREYSMDHQNAFDTLCNYHDSNDMFIYVKM